MLTIRLIRTGKKNSSSFRIVLTDKTAGPTSGRFLEVLGNYNPRITIKDEKSGKTKKEISLKTDRINYWLSQGVKTSDTVHNLLVNEEVIKGPKIRKKMPKKEVAAKGAETTKTNEIPQPVTEKNESVTPSVTPEEK